MKARRIFSAKYLLLPFPSYILKILDKLKIKILKMALGNHRVERIWIYASSSFYY